MFSSSPSTRFTGVDVDGLTEEGLPKLPLRRYMQPYAETKAMAEMEVSAACCESLLTVTVAPHQVYGPRDNLFPPNLLEVAMGEGCAFSDPDAIASASRTSTTTVTG